MRKQILQKGLRDFIKRILKIKNKVIAIAGTIGVLVTISFFKAYPIYGASILIATFGVVIGSLMYKCLKDK